MARITVSLTDELKADLEAYAEQQQLAVSKVVSLALQAYLPGEENPPDPDLVNTQHYVAQLDRQAQQEGFTRLPGWSESHPLYRGLLAELVTNALAMS